MLVLKLMVNLWGVMGLYAPVHDAMGQDIGIRRTAEHQGVVNIDYRDGKDVPTAYTVVAGFFKQDDDDTDDDSFNVVTENFGLKKGVDWQDVIDSLKEYNAKSKKSVYKLLFLARHGEGYHNIAPQNYTQEAWECYWQRQNGNGVIEWFDALLTDHGKEEIEQVNGLWKSQLALRNAPLPESFYVSPLRRTIQTFYYTWHDILEPSKNPSQNPVAKENARETYGIGTESKRHNQSYIQENWPNVQFESGFSFDDVLWTPDKHESKQHRNYRANLLLNDIFVNDSSDVISITSHSGAITSILKVINHRKWAMKTGEVIPVLVKASKFGEYEKPDLDKPWSTLPESCKTFTPPA